MFDDFNRGQKLTILVFALVNFCSAICVSLQAPFYPKEAEKKGATASDYGFVFGVYELFVFIASPILGKNMAKLGAKRVFNAGIFTTASCCILFGLLDNVMDKTTFIALSFVCRSIEAIGNACFLTASFSIIAKEFPDKVSTMFACLETCFGVGLIVGPSVGGVLFQWGGYQVPFITLGSVLIVAAIFTFFVLPSSYNESLVTGPQDKGLLSVICVPPIALSAYSVVCASVSLGFLQATLEPHLRQFDLTPVLMGGMFVIQGGTYAIAAPIWGMLCDKVLDPRLVTLTGSLLITVTFLFLGPVPFFPFPAMIEVCIATLVLHGIGFAAVLVSAFGMAHREAIKNGFPDTLSTYALISALWISTFALGACVGPSLAGVLVDNFGFGWASLFVVAAELSVFVITFTFVGYRWWRKRNFAKGYERLTPQRESGVLKKNGYGAIPTTGEPNTPASTVRRILKKTKQLYSPFVSPAARGSSLLASNIDTIVVDESADGRLAVPNKSKKSKKGRRTGVTAIIEDISQMRNEEN